MWQYKSKTVEQKTNHSLKSPEITSQLQRTLGILCIDKCLANIVLLICSRWCHHHGFLYLYFSFRKRKNDIYVLKSAQYCGITKTKRNCYCCDSRRGTYDLVFRVTDKLLSSDVFSTCGVFCTNLLNDHLNGVCLYIEWYDVCVCVWGCLCDALSVFLKIILHCFCVAWNLMIL